MNSLIDLEQQRQSPWYDQLSRSLLDTGELARMVHEDRLKGVTSNPTIFEKAIAGTHTYDPDLKRLADMGKSTREIYQTLVLEDIGRAADILRPVYDESDGEDGFVSLEVEPDLAHDKEKTVARAEELFASLKRPNVMIKVPANAPGILAIEDLIASGINVNATLIFNREVYRGVMMAYIYGLECRVAERKSLNNVASVASFFVSRIDTAIEDVITARLKVTKDANTKTEILKLQDQLDGKVAIANAKMAYQEFKETFLGYRFAKLRAKGARVQRPLWASTSAKNPRYSDLLYVESLIGPDTVNTMPPATYEAFRIRGEVSGSLEQGIKDSANVLSELANAGISLEEVTGKLALDGIRLFSGSFGRLLNAIEARTRAVPGKI